MRVRLPRRSLLWLSRSAETNGQKRIDNVRPGLFPAALLSGHCHPKSGKPK